MKNILLCVLLALTLIACGKKETPEGMTRVIFQTGDSKSIQAYSLNKGLVVYGMNLDQGKGGAGWGTNISNFISTNSEIILPNGRYKFFAVGYDDNGTPANDALHSSSKMFCGDGNNGQEVILAGGAATVSITLSDSNSGSNCNEEFAGTEFRTNSPYTNSFKDLTVTFCDSSGTNGSGCASATAAGIVSAEIKVTAYDKIKNNMDFDFARAIPGCLSVASAQLSLYKKIPYRMPFHFSIKTFNAASCTGTMLGIYDFPNGVEGVQNNLPYRTINNSLSFMTQVFLKQ